MKPRILALGFVLASLAVVPVSAAGQRKWTAPRTADGQPDLQGVWTNATVTPLERPAQFKDKEFLTEQEAIEFAKQAIYQADGDRRDGTPEADVGRAYNEFWRDRGQVVPTRRSSLILDPPDGRIPPVTPEGQKRNAERAAARKQMGGAFDGPENRSLQERCLLTPQSGPPMLPANYNSNYQIVQNRDYVAILVEMIHDVRIIPLNGMPHLPKNTGQWLGDSRGRWEGDTLIVETTNFTDQTNFRGSSKNLRVIERFTRTGPDGLLYQFTIEDPATWSKPWSAEIPMDKALGQIFEFACHEGNYGIAGVLAGARAAEKNQKE